MSKLTEGNYESSVVVVVESICEQNHADLFGYNYSWPLLETLARPRAKFVVVLYTGFCVPLPLPSPLGIPSSFNPTKSSLAYLSTFILLYFPSVLPHPFLLVASSPHSCKHGHRSCAVCKGQRVAKFVYSLHVSFLIVVCCCQPC